MTMALTLMAVCLNVSGSEKKTNLSVLYVGGFSNYETVGGTSMDAATIGKARQERVASWTAYLNERFTTVKVIDGQAYRYTMSNDYDVTIFDGYPKPLKPKQYVKDSQGRIQRIIYDEYFPANFDRPVLCIADASEQVGRYVGTKNDWYCLCLTGWALNVNTQHAIFKGPYPVKLTMTEQPMPDGAKDYAKMFGQQLPATINMWKVNTRDYENTRGFKVGMVARPWGYTDSPETEIISGGKSAKSIDAVAVSRHANFMHWGFAGAPMDMTDEAKAVFANAVCYISKYAGQHPLARKLSEGIATKETAKEMSYILTHKAYEENIAANKQFAQQMQHYSDSLKAVLAQGGRISQGDSMYLNYQPAPEATFEEYMKQRAGNLYERFGTDEKAYAAYYRDNAPYLYSAFDGERDGIKYESYQLYLDEDAKALGIAVYDKRLLEKAIELWESGKDTERARRILYRRTLLRYNNARAFRQWYDKFRTKLFFTESGGWVWLVNSMDPRTPGNDYSVLRYNEAPAAPEKKPEITATLSPQQPVAVSAIANDLGNGTKDIVVRMKMHTGFHIYGVVSKQDPYIVTSVEVIPPAGYTVEGALQRPSSFRQLGTSGTIIYEGDVLFHQHLKGTGSGRATVKVRYQACDEHACLLPQDIEIPVEL